MEHYALSYLLTVFATLTDLTLRHVYEWGCQHQQREIMMGGSIVRTFTKVIRKILDTEWWGLHGDVSLKLAAKSRKLLTIIRAFIRAFYPFSSSSISVGRFCVCFFHLFVISSPIIPAQKDVHIAY